ncbi:MAG: S1C family serine protease [Actinomycetota bacterium]|nr:S1C family serine protease [Actinomycetota bacterium]
MEALLALLLVVASVAAGVLLTREAAPATETRAAASAAVAADSPGSTALDGDFSQVYADVADGVGLVVVVSCAGESFTGSAFLVGADTMLTAAHVVSDVADVRVELDAAVVGATVESIDLTHDLALLRLDAPVPGHVFEFSSGDPPTGAPVAAIGYPLGEARTLTVGTISGLDRDISTETGDYEGLVQTDTAINPGSSGGPVLAASGEVVAVADAVRIDAQGIGFGVAASVAADLAHGSGPRTSPQPCR